MLKFNRIILSAIPFHVLRFACAIFILVINRHPGVAQQKYFRFERITTENGLPTDNITKLLQDKQGLIWIGTSEGLCRYDGYHVTTFRYDPGDTHSLANNYVYDLSEDENGNMWIATAGGWCELLFNSQTFLRQEDFKSFHGKAPAYFIEFILADHYHHIFFAGNEGAAMLDLKDSTFEKFPVPDHDTLPPSSVIHIIQDGQSVVWLSFQNCIRGYDPVNEKAYSPFFNPDSLPLQSSKAFLYNKGNIAWFGTWGQGLYAFDKTNHKMLMVGKDTATLPELLINAALQTVQQDKDGNFWLLLEGKGVAFLDFQNNEFQFMQNQPDDVNSIPSMKLRDLMVDRDGNIWIATGAGVALHTNQRQQFQWKTYTGLVSKSADVFDAKCLLSDDSTLLVGTWPHGLFSINKQHPSSWQHLVIGSDDSQNDMSNLTNSLLRDHEGVLWVSTQTGYARYDNTTHRYIPYYLDRHDITGTRYYQVSMIMEDDSDNLWIASKKGLGKVKRDRANVTWYSLPVMHNTGLPFMITKVIQGNDSLLWLITDGGLFSFNRFTEKFLRYHSDERGVAWSAFDDDDDALHFSDSIIFIGSQFNGLIRFNTQTKTFKIYTTKDGLSSNNIAGLFMDDYNGLWITTMNGMSRMDLSNETFSRYDKSNGLKAMFFSNSDVFCKQPDGTILMMDNTNIFQFNPRQFQQQEHTPQVSFTSFDKYGVPVFFDQPVNDLIKLNLRYRDRFFTIQFSTLKFADLSRTVYEYKLEGLDDEWHLTTVSPYVSYSNLPGGNYVLHVRASLGGSLWGPEKRLSISIASPFWQTWWFYLLCAVVVSAILYALYRYRLNQLLRLQRVRNRISQDLHDDIGSTLSSMNIMTTMAKTKATSSEEFISKIQDEIKDVSQSLDDIVWSVNPKNDNWEMLLTRMRFYASDLLEHAGIHAVIEIPDQTNHMKMNAEQRHDFYLFFKEAINNVAKHSEATDARVKLTEEKKDFDLLIEDNGKGFNPEKPSERNGLDSMRKRAKSMNAELNIQSQQGGGTIIHLKIKIT